MQNLAWDSIKSALPTVKQRELTSLKRALEDTQRRNLELEVERELLGEIVRQRNVALHELTSTRRELKTGQADLRRCNRRVAELEALLARRSTV